MAKPTKKPVRLCIYCGDGVTKERRGEHIVPEAIGGELTLKEVAKKSVCTPCNTRVLSNIDRELCNRSYLSTIASQEIEANLWQVWDIDHAAHNLLVEAKPLWQEGELKSLVCHPQMIFEAAGPQIRGDAKEMERFGKENVLKVMARAVHGAFERYNAGKKGALHFERVRTDIASRNYRLPPRVYSPHSFAEIASDINNQSFVLRYLAGPDLRFALRTMSQLDVGNKRLFNRFAHFVGSRVPAISIYFDAGMAVRAMMKIAVNLLAAYCSKTTVNCNTFPQVTRLILGESHPDDRLVAGNGFVDVAGVEELAQPRCHCFRITYLNEWVVYASYFGGRIGSVVSFPGPKAEDWNTMDIVVPIHSKDWRVERTRLYRPLKVRVNWTENTSMCPSLKLQYSQSRVLVEKVPKRKS